MTKLQQWDIGWVCPACGQKRTGDDDPCIENLPGIKNACCGHGGHGQSEGYLYFENGVRLGFILSSISYDDGRPSIIFSGAPRHPAVRNIWIEGKR